MSKFIDAIEAKLAVPQERKELLWPPELVAHEWYIEEAPYILDKYSIGVNYGLKMYIPYKNRETHLEKTKEIVKKRLHRDIYGEFEERLYKLRISILEHDTMKSLELLDEIINDT